MESLLAESSNGSDHRRQAAQYLQRLDDARTFVRYAEEALEAARQLAPDDAALRETIKLRNVTASLRRLIQQGKLNGNARFNPKRAQRRVVIRK